MEPINDVGCRQAHHRHEETLHYRWLVSALSAFALLMRLEPCSTLSTSAPCCRWTRWPGTVHIRAAELTPYSDDQQTLSHGVSVLHFSLLKNSVTLQPCLRRRSSCRSHDRLRESRRETRCTALICVSYKSDVTGAAPPQPIAEPQVKKFFFMRHNCVCHVLKKAPCKVNQSVNRFCVLGASRRPTGGRQGANRQSNHAVSTQTKFNSWCGQESINVYSDYNDGMMLYCDNDTSNLAQPCYN